MMGLNLCRRRIELCSEMVLTRLARRDCLNKNNILPIPRIRPYPLSYIEGTTCCSLSPVLITAGWPWPLAAPPHLALILAEEDSATPTSPATTPGRAPRTTMQLRGTEVHTPHPILTRSQVGAQPMRDGLVLKSRTARLLCKLQRTIPTKSN